MCVFALAITAIVWFLGTFLIGFVFNLVDEYDLRHVFWWRYAAYRNFFRSLFVAICKLLCLLLYGFFLLVCCVVFMKIEEIWYTTWFANATKVFSTVSLLALIALIIYSACKDGSFINRLLKKFDEHIR